MIDTGSATKDETTESENKPIEDDTKDVAPSSQVVEDIRQASETETELDERKEILSKEESSKDLNEEIDKIENSNGVKSDEEDASTKEERSDMIDTGSATTDEASESEKKPMQDDTKFVSPSSELVLENSLQASTESKVDERKEIGTKEESTNYLNEGIDKIETSDEMKSDEEDSSTKEERSDMNDTGSATKVETSESEKKPMQDETKHVARSSQIVEGIRQASETETEFDERKEIGTNEENYKDLNEEIDKIETSNEVKSDEEDASTKEERSDLIDTGSATKDVTSESEKKPLQDDSKHVSTSSQVVEDIRQTFETETEISGSEIKPIGDDTKVVVPLSQVFQENSLETDTGIDFDERKELGTKEGSSKVLNEDKIETSKESKSDGVDASNKEKRTNLIYTASATKDKTSKREKKPIEDDTKDVAPSSQVVEDISQASETETELDERKEIGTTEESTKDLNKEIDKIETSNEVKSDEEDASTKEEGSDKIDTGSATKDEASESEKKPMQDDTKHVAPFSHVVADISQASETETELYERKEIGTKEESTKDLNEEIDKIETSNEVKSDEEYASTKEERSDLIDTGSATKDETSECEVKPNKVDTKYVDPSSQVIQENSLETDTEINVDERKELGTKTESLKVLNEYKIETSNEEKSDGEVCLTKEERNNLIGIVSATTDETSESQMKPTEDDTKYVASSYQEFPSSKEEGRKGSTEATQDGTFSSELKPVDDEKKLTIPGKENDIHERKELDNENESAQESNKELENIGIRTEDAVQRSDEERSFVKEEKIKKGWTLHLLSFSFSSFYIIFFFILFAVLLFYKSGWYEKSSSAISNIHTEKLFNPNTIKSSDGTDSAAEFINEIETKDDSFISNLIEKNDPVVAHLFESFNYTDS
ncbi:hypothetical protein AVEN_267236-1, partial [Araneus ventricosus]